MTRVLLHNDQTSELAAQLRAAMPDVVCETCESYDGLDAKVQAFEPEVVYSVRFAGTAGFPQAALFRPGGPRWVANGGAGTDHFGIWDTQSVTVTNAAGVAAGMMAEYILGAFLHFNLDVPGLQQDQAARRWDPKRLVAPLQRRTLLIVGLGHTGRALAKRAAAFGMHVIGTRARPADTEGVDEVHHADSLPSLLPQADFIAVCTPLLPSTRGLLSADLLNACKPGAVLADVSRGGVVAQDAVLENLRNGRLRGAALDVFETEPLPGTSPLWSAPNLLISPHCSSVYAEWGAASFALFLDNLKRWRAGEILRNIVDPVRGY